MIRNFIKKYFLLYDLEDLRIGGHCGCCGRWVKDVIVPEDWAITICSKCRG